MGGVERVEVMKVAKAIQWAYGKKRSGERRQNSAGK